MPKVDRSPPGERKPSAEARSIGPSPLALRTELLWPRAGRPSPRFAPPPETYLMSMDFAEVGGRLGCVRFEIAANPALEDPIPVTASAVRSVPLRELVDEALFDHTRRLRRWARQPGPIGANARYLRAQVAAAEATLRRGPGRPPEYSDDHFKLVADAYTRAWTIGEHPTRAVAARWSVSRSAAAKWVARAREKGYLPPTVRGRPKGGETHAEAPEAPAHVRPTFGSLEELERLEAIEAIEEEVLRRHESFLARLGAPHAEPAGSPRSGVKLKEGRAGARGAARGTTRAPK